MATLTIEIKNLMLFVERANHLTHVLFPTGHAHELWVTGQFETGGGAKYGEFMIGPGSDVSICSDTSSTPIDGGVRTWNDPNGYLPKAGDLFQALGRAGLTADASTAQAPAAKVGAPRLSLQGGTFTPVGSQRYPELADVSWTFGEGGATYTHRITDTVLVTFEVQVGSYTVRIVDEHGATYRSFDVGASGYTLTCINRDDCDPPSATPLLELQDFEELYAAAGIAAPYPIPFVASPPTFNPNRYLRFTRRSTEAAFFHSCDAVCGGLRIDG